MSRAKDALITLTIVTALAGLILVTIGVVGTTAKHPAAFVGGATTTTHAVSYGPLFTGVGLLAWATLMLIALLAAAMVGAEIRQLKSPAVAPPGPTPEDDARRDTGRSARFASAARSGGLSWSNDPD